MRAVWSIYMSYGHLLWIDIVLSVLTNYALFSSEDLINVCIVYYSKGYIKTV